MHNIRYNDVFLASDMFIRQTSVENHLAQMIQSECTRRIGLGEVPCRQVGVQPLPASGAGASGRGGCATSGNGNDANTTLSSGAPGVAASASSSSVTAPSTPSEASAMQLVSVDDSQSQSGSQATGVTRLTWNNCKQSLGSCHRAFLVKRIHQLEEKCERQSKELKRCRREIKVLQNKSLATLDSKTRSDLATYSDDAAALEISRVNIRLTKRGFVAMGVRKALGFPLVTLTDTSRQTVARSEVSVWSMLVARTGAWHKCIYDALEEIAAYVRSMSQSPEHATTSEIGNQHQCGSADFSGDQLQIVCNDLGLPRPTGWCFGSTISECGEAQYGLFTLGGTSISGDATNSGIWRRNKLQSLLVTSAALTNAKKLASDTSWPLGFSHHTTV